MRVLLVGDFRQEQVKFISSIERIEVIGHLVTGENAINYYDDLDVDLILMDMNMPGMTGLEAARWIREQAAKVKIVLLAESLTRDYLMACMQLKLDGCILKNATPAAFAETLLACRDCIAQ
jgi:DNA-binding NarL/FixJ family response regulator